MSSRVEDVVSLTKDLVTVRSYAEDVVDSKSYSEVNGEVMAQVLDRAENYLSDIDGLDTERYSCEGRESLIATFGGTKNVDLMLHGHLDVVQPDEDNYIGEKKDQHFEPAVEEVEGERRIYGRGTGDMKAGAACLMRVLKEVSGEKPEVGLMLTTDEEKGGFRGAKYLLEEGYSANFAISAEPNNTDGGYLDIVNKQKGVLRVEITARGESAHASRKWKGENAIEKLMEAYLNRIKPIFSDTHGPTWKTTANLGRIDGGDGLNKVPDEASIGLDIRWSEEKPAEKVKEEINDRLSGLDDVEAKYKVNEPMLNTEADDKVNRLQEITEEVIGKPSEDVCRITRKSPGSDARHFMREGIPAVVFGPEGYNSHQKDEYAVVDSFEDYIEIIRKFALEERN